MPACFSSEVSVHIGDVCLGVPFKRNKQEASFRTSSLYPLPPIPVFYRDSSQAGGVRIEARIETRARIETVCSEKQLGSEGQPARAGWDVSVSFAHRCLVKWLEVRCVCPMCNKPIAGPTEATQSIGILLDELV